MPEKYRIIVDNYRDAVLLRMQARHAARVYGFTLKNQASISLAMWSIINTLGLGQSCKAKFIIEPVKNGDRTGMRMICNIPDCDLPELTPEMFSQARWMVDELNIKSLPGKGFKVTIIKWMEGYDGYREK